MKRLEAIEKSYQESLSYIKSVAQENTALGRFALWLLDTDSNPYEFLPENYARGFNTAEGIESLFRTISHALSDDGEICYPVVNGIPRITFADKRDSDIRDRVLRSFEKDMDRNEIYRRASQLAAGESLFKIEFLDSLDDFVRMYQRFREDELREYFLNDVEDCGFESAIDAYSIYQEFNPEWIKDIK